MSEEKETWKNVTAGIAAVIKADPYGRETHEIVEGGRSFSILKRERILNMDRAATPSLDLFSNGTLIPIRLLDGDEVEQEVAAHPNWLSDSDLAGLFKLNWRQFDAKIKDIESPMTLHRLLEVANEVDATIRQVGTITEQLNTIAPPSYSEVHVTQVGAAGMSGEPDRGTGSPVTPK